jgi:hypothetical protein
MRLLGQLSRTAGSDRSYGSDYGEREMMNEESEFRFPGTLSRFKNFVNKCVINE